MPFAIVFMNEVGDKKDPETLTIQAYLDSEYLPDKNFMFAGWRGKPSSEWCWPVVFKPSGTVEHGGVYGEENVGRFSFMQIYEKSFEHGAVYEMSHSDDSPSTFLEVTHIRILP